MTKPTNYYSSALIYRTADRSLIAFIPKRQLLNQSLQLIASDKPFTDWSDDDHANSYSFMLRIAQLWNSRITNQYLIYGKIDENSFFWEMVPYQKCHTCVGRAFQQLQVLYRTMFGGSLLSPTACEQQSRIYRDLLYNRFLPLLPEDTSVTGKDPFCDEKRIERQWVVTGKKVHVLFNYAPIGFGGERLHFLIVAKQHRETFTDVTQEEYSESMQLTCKLVRHFQTTRNNIKHVYLLNKTGRDAGQTVKHWHIHVIFSMNAAQDFWGKMTVIKNILLGSSRMRDDLLEAKVSNLRTELKHLKAE